MDPSWIIDYQFGEVTSLLEKEETNEKHLLGVFKGAWARRGLSTSHSGRAMCFNEAPPGHSPQPKRRAL